MFHVICIVVCMQFQREFEVNLQFDLKQIGTFWAATLLMKQQVHVPSHFVFLPLQTLPS